MQDDAEIAQLVEHDLAKVGVASSSLVFRSERRSLSGNSSVGRARPCQGRGREFESRFPLKSPTDAGMPVLECSGGGMVDTRDLKSLARKGVWVQVPPGVQRE